MTEITLCSPEELRQKMTSGEKICLVDVREVEEHEAERISGSFNFPLSRFKEHLSSIPKSEPIYLLCRLGGRAYQAAHYLGEIGYPSVQVVAGGLESWKEKGYPVEGRS